MEADGITNLFIKVVLNSDKLVFPPKFARQHGKALSGSVKLKLPFSSEWDIGLKKSDNGKIWLKYGWAEFLSFYSIEKGQILIFTYEGNSEFRVSIIDRTSCEISHYPRKKASSTEIRGESSKKKKKNKSARPSKAEIARSMRRLSKGEKRKCLAMAKNFTSDKPYVKIPMQPSYVTQSRLTIPASFASEHLRKKVCDVTLHLHGSKGRSWKMKYNNGDYKPNRPNPTAKLHGGWKIFTSDNDLETGDLCVFVLNLSKKSANISFDVIIFRANKRDPIHSDSDSDSDYDCEFDCDSGSENESASNSEEDDD